MGLFSDTDEGHVNVVATVKAKAGHEAALRVLLEASVFKARLEEGCEDYHLLEDKKVPGSFYTYEEWVSEAALEVHLEGAKPMLEKAKGLIDGELKVVVLEHLV